MPSEKPHVFRRTVPDRVVELGPGKMRVRYEPGEFVEAVVASLITRITWDRGAVAAGGLCALTVSAWGVAPGRRCEVRLEDERGRTLATLKHPAIRVGGDWQVLQDAPLTLTPDAGEYTARVLVPAGVTRKAQGHLTAHVRLPEVGIGYVSQRLPVRPRVAVRAVQFLAERERRVLTEVPSGRTVRIQAQIDVLGGAGRAEDLEGAEAKVRLFRRAVSEAPEDLKTDRQRAGRASLYPVAELKAWVQGPPGRQGVEVLWEASVERAIRQGTPAKARRPLLGQRAYDEEARAEQAPARRYRGVELVAEVELWGAFGRTTDPGSRGGSGPLKVRDTLGVQVVLAGSEEPLAGVETEIELPDGTVRRGALDRQGRAHLTGVPPGRCVLTVQRPDEGWPALQSGPDAGRLADDVSGFEADQTIESFAELGMDDVETEGFATGILTRVVVWPPHVKLNLRRALIGGGRDMAGAAFRLEEAGGGLLAEGALPDKGEDRPLLVGLPEGTTSKLKLILWPFGGGAQTGPPYAYRLEASAFEESSTLTGAQRRLANLGYSGVEATGTEERLSSHALAHVQTLTGDAATGHLDERAASFVEALHDTPA